MTSLLQEYGVGFAGILGLLGFLIGITGPNTGIVIASGIWYGSALIAAQVAKLNAAAPKTDAEADFD